MPLSFTISGDYPIGDDPVALAVADLNGDGTPDIVTVNRHDGTISVLQGNGDGTFSGAATLPVGSFPASVAVADLNGDGAADLAVAVKDDRAVAVLLGNGDGTFASQTNLATADTLPLSVTIGDLNGDGKLDLVTGSATWGDTSVSVLLGNGDGTFQEQVPYSVPGAPNAVALADLNGDGKADLVAVSSFTSVLLGNGDGTFQAPELVGYGGYSVAIADLNGDHILDLVKTQGTSVLVQLGNGDGTFQEQTSYADGPGSFRVAVADLDGDGRPDLAVDGDYGVQVLLGNGDGTFQPAQSFSVDLPHAVAIADLNNDGKLDIATVNATDTVSILFNTPNVPPTIRLFDDTGASASDHITANPILTGTAAPGTAVTLMEGTTVLGTGTVDGTGTWGFLPTIGEGSHTVTVNTAGGSSSLTFTLDNSLVTPTIGLAHDTGTSASDHITSDATLTGTTDAGAAVAVYDLTGLITSGGSSPPVLLATVTADAGGTWSYTPSVADGPHAFMAHATDLAGNMRDSAPLYMTLDTTAVNDAPVAHDDSYSLAEDTTLTVASPAILANDSDADGDTLSAALVSGPAHGSLVLNANGALTYAPAANFNGTDSFTYKVNDGQADSNVATVTLTVTPVNDAPVAHDDAFTTNEDTALTVPAAGVLGNDSDIDSASLSSVLVSGPAHGTLALNADGLFTYTPQANYNGSDSFTYKANDGLAESGVATAHITINPVNDAPVAHADIATVTEDASVLLNVRANDIDADGDALSIASLSGAKSALGASISIESGQIRYTADADSFDLLAPGATVADSFAYTVADGHGGFSTTTVNVTVTGDQNNTVVNLGNGDHTFVDITGGRDTTVYGGNGADTIVGGDGADVLYGQNGADILNGGNGIDLLFGGQNNDWLTGGAGSDTFVFQKSGGDDTITDFQIGIDHVRLDDGLTVKSVTALDVDHTGALDAVLELSGGSVTLFNTGAITDWHVLL